MKAKARMSWYLADVVERCETAGIKVSARGRYLTWVNTVLIRAASLTEAYDEALKVAKKTYNSRYKAASGRNVRWKVLGLSSLLPVYEPLRHGSEIIWEDRGYLSAKRSGRMIRSKRELISRKNG